MENIDYEAYLTPIVNYLCDIIDYPSTYGWVIEYGLCIIDYDVYLRNYFLKLFRLIDYIEAIM